MADEKKHQKKITKKMPKIVYTSEEEDWLVTNVLKYRAIIENKKTDGATNRDKEQAWEKIGKAFNVAPTGRERAVKSLREKYQKIKQTLKDRAYYYLKDAKQTGGGPPKKELPPLSEPMKELAELIMPSTIGLAATAGDSDGTIANQLALQSTSRKIASTTTPKSCADALATADPSTSLRKPAEEMPDDGAAVDRTWERVNPSKPANLLLTDRRSKTNSEAINKIPKMSEQKQEHLTKKQKIEIEILECERERYKFERERAELDRDRAALDRERSAIELERSKAELRNDAELHRLRLAALSRDKDDENPIETLSSVPTAAAKTEYFCD